MAKTRTVEGQLIGIKRNNAKNTSQKRIQSLINQQIDLDHSVSLRTNANVQIENVPIKECSLTFEQAITYHMPIPKQPSQLPIPITQDEGYGFNVDDGILQQQKNTQHKWYTVTKF